MPRRPDQPERIRIGAVSYLNTVPLVQGLEERADEYELIFDLPGRLADSLRDGQLDVALIPSIEAVDRDYTIVSDACIACLGPVWSVKLMSRVAPEEIRTLALDEGSRTSRALTQILLRHRHGVTPECTRLDIDADWRGVGEDAVLIIGDRAMRASDSGFPFEIDLGQAWFDWTGLPFVFAVWAARNDLGEPGGNREQILTELGDALTFARDTGTASVDRLSQQLHEQYGLTQQECVDYLGHKLNFTLDRDGKLALEKYYRLAAEMNLVSDHSPLQFHAAAH